ncbi:MAG TPA: phosphotransferase [Gaiellaceae bacterium]|nr:phosphotransferase [Gaiellaceae bacterium]
MKTMLQLDESALVEHVREQRWFGAKSRELVGANVLDSAVLREIDPPLQLVLAELRYPEGTHDLYQLLLGEDEDWSVREIVHMIRSGARVPGTSGTVEFAVVPGFGLGRDLQDARRIESEQSNTSVVFDDELILKVFRRLEAGLNPELELLRFLTERQFPHIPPLGGWYAYVGRPLEATLGILQAFVPGAVDGWELALRELERSPDGFLARLRRLGEVTGALHTTLGTEGSDPAFCPEEPSAEALALLTATIDDEIESVFAELPDNPALEPIAGRGEDVRERLRGLTQLGSIGRIIRHHGDYHLGQVLWAAGDWLVIDFEGEPARPLPERRRKRSPLRDVAGMLRSFAYAATAGRLLRNVDVPDDWEQRARTEFLHGYLASVDTALLPAGDEAINRLLAIFELEKAVYELRYELDNRPDWVSIPVAGIARLLES